MPSRRILPVPPDLQSGDQNDNAGLQIRQNGTGRKI